FFLFFFFLLILPSPRSTLFPYTTLFRSRPLSINGTRVGIEFFILGFSNGGIAAVIYEEFFKKRIYRPKLRNSISVNLLAIYSLTDRKSTRLNSSHLGISYAVFCLKKKNK